LLPYWMASHKVLLFQHSPQSDLRYSSISSIVILSFCCYHNTMHVHRRCKAVSFITTYVSVNSIIPFHFFCNPVIFFIINLLPIFFCNVVVIGFESSFFRFPWIV
jgi:hypothetical protein